jgi:UDP-glucose 4-epimerase
VKWLITGGAGYIGSHVLADYLAAGIETEVIDSLVTGNKQRVRSDVRFHQVDILDSERIAKIFKEGKFDGVMHIAGIKSVSESIKEPLKYHKVNDIGSRVIFDSACKSGVGKIVFSSTAAVYGNSPTGIATEGDATRPLSPYGESKLSAEKYLAKVSQLHGINAISLRYFNVSGRSNPLLGEVTSNSLIPRTVSLIKMGEKPTIYGNNYDTKDGTCIRDFIDVRDLAKAHFQIAIKDGSLPKVLNLGSGGGFSVKEVIDSIKDILDSSVEVFVGEKRSGDMPILIANIEVAEKVLDFKLRFNLEDMIESLVA